MKIVLSILSLSVLTLALIYFSPFSFQNSQKMKEEEEKKMLSALNVPPDWSRVEQQFLLKSGRSAVYSGELIPSIETENLSDLGKLSALKFIDWVYSNPEGVVAFTTQKIAEPFIEALKYYKNHWSEPAVQRDLRHMGINPLAFPETKRLKLVQLNEFFPINSSQSNSLTSYVRRNYLSLLEIPEENFLSMKMCDSKNFLPLDLAWISKKIDPTFLVFKEEPLYQIDPSLSKKKQRILRKEQKDKEVKLNKKERRIKEILVEANQRCLEYDEAIRAWGGIGFILYAIDSHLDSPNHTKTGLAQLNYPSAANLATHLGGIEHARDKAIVTVGLETIAFNPEVTAILMVGGEGKASLAQTIIEGQNGAFISPAGLHSLKGSRCYMTRGAARMLEARQIEDVEKKKWQDFTKKEIDDVVISLALKKKKRLQELTLGDFESEKKEAIFIKKCPQSIEEFLFSVEKRLIQKIERAIPEGLTILHTSPHHDDVELAYYPLVRALLKLNRNDFLYATSGFNAVTDKYIAKLLEEIPEETFDKTNPSLFEFLEKTDITHMAARRKFEKRLLLKNLAEIYQIEEESLLKEKVEWLQKSYFPEKQPGVQDTSEIQRLKGTMRESETERMLSLLGVSLPHIYHLRAEFYNGDSSSLVIEKDVASVAQLYREIQPDLITVAFDPEGTGPDTHYKVLQVIAQALKKADFPSHLKIWGYRNVWHRFSFAEANCFFPVLEDEMEELNEAFLSCFSTQKEASFPSPEYEGPFSELAVNIQKEYRNQLGVLLGEEYFKNHSQVRFQKAKGFILFREMDQKEFLKNVFN